MRNALFPRVFRQCLALTGAGLLLLGMRPLPAAADLASPSVSVTTTWEWTEQRASATWLHLGGEVKNNETTRRAGLIDVHYVLTSASGRSSETVYVWEMGADILDPGQTTPYQEVIPEPSGYIGPAVLDPASPVTATDPLTPSNHLFTVVPHACADVADFAHVCGTVVNNNTTTVDNIRVIISYRHTDQTGLTSTVDEDMSTVITDDPMYSLGSGQSADFQEVVRPDGAPPAESVTMFAESPTTAPGRPADVAATFGNGSATVSWTAPVDGGRAITGYTVTASGTGGQQTIVGANATSATVAGLANGTTYSFTVTATNPVGNGDPSDPSNAVDPGTVPDQPTGVTAVAGLRSATVSWTAPSGEGRQVTQYAIAASPGGAVTTVTGNPPATSTFVNGLTSGTTYTFTVTATNELGTSAPSSPSNAVTPTGPPPQPTTPPTTVTASAGFGYAVVNWSGATSDPSFPITTYTVTASPGPITLTTSGTNSSAIVGGLKRGSYTFTVTSATADGAGPSSLPSNPVAIDAAGQYHPLVPVRILDTRDGTGKVQTVPLGQGKTMNVPIRTNPVLAPILAASGVDASGVAAVVMNVTVTQGTFSSYLSVYPTGSVQTLPPNSSSLNFVHQDVPNLVFATLGDGGAVTAYNNAGSVHVIFDVQGWISTPDNISDTSGQLRSIAPARLLDTRVPRYGVPRMAPDSTINLKVAGVVVNGVPIVPPNASAVALNVTAGGPSPGFITVFPTGTTRPEKASNLNLVPGQYVSNRVIAKVGGGGQVSIYSLPGVDVVVDINGWFTDGSDPSATAGEFTGVAPYRILDTRSADQSPVGKQPMPDNGTLTIQVAGTTGKIPGVPGVPAMNASPPPAAVVLNVTATDTTFPGYLGVYPADPGIGNRTSDVNWGAVGATVPNLVVVKLNHDGSVTLYNCCGSTDAIIDVLGWYSAPPQ